MLINTNATVFITFILGGKSQAKRAKSALPKISDQQWGPDPELCHPESLDSLQSAPAHTCMSTNALPGFADQENSRALKEHCYVVVIVIARGILVAPFGKF